MPNVSKRLKTGLNVSPRLLLRRSCPLPEHGTLEFLAMHSSMNRRQLGWLISLLGATTVGYAYSLVAATPEEILRQPFVCPNQLGVAAKNFQVLSVRKWDKGVVALYRGTCAFKGKRFASEAKQNEAVLSYRVVERTGMEWQTIGTGNHRSRMPDSSPKLIDSKLIDYGVGKPPKNTQPSSTLSQNYQYTVFFGQVLSPMVSAVEVTFDNGKILRDSSPDGLFLLVSPGATSVCDVRILGTDNQILQRDEMTALSSQRARSDTCQPISGQL